MELPCTWAANYELGVIFTQWDKVRHSIIKWKQHIWNWAWASSEGKKLYEEVTQTPTVGIPFLLHYLLSPSLYVWPHGKFSAIRWVRKRMHSIQVPPKRRTAEALRCLSGMSQRTVVKGNSPVGTWSCTWLFTLLGRRNDQMWNYVPIHELWLTVWLDGQKFGRNVIRKLVSTKFKKEWMDPPPLLMGEKESYFVSHMNAHQGVTSAEEDFNN